MELIAIAALGAGGYWLYKTFKDGPKYPFESVTGGTTKKPWKTRVIAIKGTGDSKLTTVEVWAPAGVWGPHLDVLVTTYQQRGSDKSSRVSLGTGPNAVPQMVTAAGLDFGIKSPSAGTTVSGAPKPDHKLPLLRYGQRVGTINVWHNGKTDWIWRAHSNSGALLAKGRAKTLNGAQQAAAVRTVISGHSPDIIVSGHTPDIIVSGFNPVPGDEQMEPEMQDSHRVTGVPGIGGVYRKRGGGSLMRNLQGWKHHKSYVSRDSAYAVARDLRAQGLHARVKHHPDAMRHGEEGFEVLYRK